MENEHPLTAFRHVHYAGMTDARDSEKNDPTYVDSPSSPVHPHAPESEENGAELKRGEKPELNNDAELAAPDIITRHSSESVGGASEDEGDQSTFGCYVM